MTSKSLFFNLMKENTKRRLWMAALFSLIFFFMFPVWAAMYISNYLTPSMYEGMSDQAVLIAGMKADVLEGFLDWASVGNGFTVFIMTVFAVVSAISGFAYLHSRQKVDFFHSIPVKRQKLFAAVYVNGILYAAVPYLVSLILASILVQVKAAPAFPWGEVMKGFAVHMTFYILLYSTAVVAVMMTGNTIVSILGTVVFFLWGPVILLLKYGYCEEFLKTFYANDRLQTAVLRRSSPFAYYVGTASAFPGENVGIRVACALIAAAVLTAIALLLYKKRPSEAAGKAMAFKKSQAVIKILLVVPAALLGGLMFYAMKESDGWCVFGLLCGLLITYCIIEIIYNFDFRRLFAHKVQLAVCVLISGAILAFFRFDLSGYDSYIPSAEKVASGAFYSYYLDPETNQKYRVTLKSDEDGYVGFDYGSTQDLLREMKLSDIEDLLTIASAGVQNVNAEKERVKEIYRAASYESSFGSAYDNEEKTPVVIAYHMKNGREAARRYYINPAAVEEAVSSVYMQKEYKETVYPLLLRSEADIAGVNYQEYDDFRHVKLPEEGMKDRLLAAYQKELRELTLETRKKESPIAALQFKTNQMQEMIDLVRAKKWDFTVFNYYEYYPIYPSFTETIALLKQCGIDVGNFLNRDNVEKIEIVYYGNDEDDEDSVFTDDGVAVRAGKGPGDSSITIEDKEQIEEILKASYGNALNNENSLRRESAYFRVTAFVPAKEASVTDDEFYDGYEEQEYEEKSGYHTYRLILFEESIPAFLTERIKNGFD